MGRIRQAATQAQAAGVEARHLIAKASAVLDEITDLLDKLEDEGIEIGLQVRGKEIPIHVKIKLSDDPDDKQPENK